ncbi:MAG: CPBP family intramembrane metalloprotease [Clostridia bacterium]|nr:CPBP family intramembrane metalloprotease [Clostridia bacterium]
MKKFFIGIGAVVGYLAINLALSFVVTIAAAFYFVFTQNQPIQAATDPNSVLNAMIGYLYDHATILTVVINLLSLLVYFAIIKIRKKKVTEHLDLVPLGLDKLWPLIPLGFSLNILTIFMINILPIPASVMEDYASSVSVLDNKSVTVTLLTTVLFAPLFEEILFRGLILNSLKRIMWVPLAIVIESAIFGLMHGQILWMCYAGVLGIFLSVIRLRYRSLYASMLLHAVYNATSYILQLAGDLNNQWIFNVILLISSLFMAIFFGIIVYKKTKPVKEGVLPLSA